MKLEGKQATEVHKSWSLDRKDAESVCNSSVETFIDAPTQTFPKLLFKRLATWSLSHSLLSCICYRVPLRLGKSVESRVDLYCVRAPPIARGWEVECVGVCGCVGERVRERERGVHVCV